MSEVQKYTDKENIVSQDPHDSSLVNPYAPGNRKAMTTGSSVKKFLRSNASLVTVHSRKLPRLPLANTIRRQFKKPISLQLHPNLHLKVTGLLGSGGFAHVFAATTSTKGSPDETDVAVKFETGRSTLAWEYYIVNRINVGEKIASAHERWPPVPRPQYLGLNLFTNGSMLLMNKGCAGTLHDLLNTYKKLGKAFPETLVVYYSIRMLRSIEQLHAANIIHGDIKPDNWLFAPALPDTSFVDNNDLQVKQGECMTGDLCLIDFGRSIDVSGYPTGTRFVGDCHTKGFQCVEMLSGRPWTFQIDSFGFLGTIHCMLFGEYMDVRCHKVRGDPQRWTISKNFKRYWDGTMWYEIFDTLLNIPSCNEQPSLAKIRQRLENQLLFDARRRQELCELLRQQERFAAKSKV